MFIETLRSFFKHRLIVVFMTSRCSLRTSRLRGEKDACYSINFLLNLIVLHFSKSIDGINIRSN